MRVVQAAEQPLSVRLYWRQALSAAVTSGVDFICGDFRSRSIEIDPLIRAVGVCEHKVVFDAPGNGPWCFTTVCLFRFLTSTLGGAVRVRATCDSATSTSSTGVSPGEGRVSPRENRDPVCLFHRPCGLGLVAGPRELPSGLGISTGRAQSAQQRPPEASPRSRASIRAVASLSHRYASRQAP